MAEIILSAAGLTKRFPQGERETEVLHGIDLTLKAGEIVAILGPSGAGKSTLLHLLGLMEQPSSGTLRIRGDEAQSLSAVQRAQLRNQTIGFLFQFHHLLPRRNGEQKRRCAFFGGDFHDTHGIVDRFNRAAEVESADDGKASLEVLLKETGTQ